MLHCCQWLSSHRATKKYSTEQELWPLRTPLPKLRQALFTRKIKAIDPMRCRSCIQSLAFIVLIFSYMNLVCSCRFLIHYNAFTSPCESERLNIFIFSSTPSKPPTTTSWSCKPATSTDWSIKPSIYVRSRPFS